MERELLDHLQACARAFGAARRLELSTVARMAAKDGHFFERLNDPSRSFTARKYDEIIRWFDANWPDEADWPEGVGRPSQVGHA